MAGSYRFRFSWPNGGETSAFMKATRLEEHIRYAEAHGMLVGIDWYLRRLPEDEWVHLIDCWREPR